MGAAHEGSLLNNSSPSLALSNRPTGATHGRSAPAKQLYTVARPFSSWVLVTKPRGLFSISTTRAAGADFRPSISMRSTPCRTGHSGSKVTRPLTRTRPSRTHSAARVREPIPNFEITLATPCRLPVIRARSSMDRPGRGLPGAHHDDGRDEVAADRGQNRQRIAMAHIEGKARGARPDQSPGGNTGVQHTDDAADIAPAEIIH